jgi:hypothetical protein
METIVKTEWYIYLSPPLDNVGRIDTIWKVDVTIEGDFVPIYGSDVVSIGGVGRDTRR